jgi:putative thioredoxin
MDVTDASFENDVVARSSEVPVVVDLWAEWCGPCRTLTPVLERAVAASEGRVELAKVDIEANPRVAATFQVQSIPAVYALRDGQVVDGFVGALDERSVREFVERLAPSDTEADLLVAKGDEASLRAALELQPDHPGAVVALAELLVSRGDGEDALDLLAKVPETADVRRVAAMARMGGDGPGDDVEARLDELLERVKDDDDARRQFLDLLEVLGPEDARSLRYRKALTARLF